jgi:probable HAF family extracellular repeat protein
MNKLNIVRSTLALALLVAGTIAFGQGRQAAVNMPHSPPQLHYVLIDLGGYFANAITDSGQIVGSKFFGAERHGAFWPNSRSQAIDLGTLPGFTFSSALNINPRGEMVGNAGMGPAKPIFWASSQSAPIELPGLPVGLSGLASHINPVGQIVGRFESLDSSVQRPVFWPKNNAAPVYLAELSDNFPHGVAISINASGNILGDGCDANYVECHVAFWPNSASTPVALASPGGEFTYTDVGLSSGGPVAPALNNAGSMVGFAYNADFSATRAVFWTNSSSPAVILSTTDEFSNGTAEGINERGQIVGTAYNGDFSDRHAFLWPSSASQGIDLNTLIPPGSGWELVVARSINNRGEITGAARVNGAFHAYVLIPVHGPLAREFLRSIKHAQVRWVPDCDNAEAL